MSKKNSKSLSSAELSTFCGQVALILEAGLPLYDGMETLVGADKNSENADIYESASKGVNEKGSLYDALCGDERWPKYLVEMVGIGERAGQLDRVMRGLENYYAREDRIRKSIVGAITYPLVLGIMLIVIVAILLWKVLPVFRRVLASMGVGMSESGNLMMRLGVTVGWVILALVVVVVLLVVVGAVMMRTKHREKVLGLIRKIMPSFNRVNRELSASRVASVLSMMLSGGFPMDEALEMTSHVLTDRAAAEKVESIRASLNNGSSFSEAVAKAELFDELHNRMVAMGSATGREDQVLAKLADLYEEQVEDGITRMVAIIEPTLVALLSIVIGAVLLSVMLPMAGILSSL